MESRQIVEVEVKAGEPLVANVPRCEFACAKSSALFSLPRCLLLPRARAHRILSLKINRKHRAVARSESGSFLRWRRDAPPSMVAASH